MKRWIFGFSALPLLLASGMLTPGCTDDADDCAARANCAEGQGGSAGSPGTGGGGDGGQGVGAQGGGQGGQGAAAGQGGQGGQGGDMPPPSCIPWENATGVGVPDTCGVFVASSGAGAGTQASPFGTVSDALSAAQSGDAIYLCNEIFEESLTVPSGVTVYGGLDCTNGWTFETGARTTLMGVANTPAARFSEGNATTTLYDIELAAADATNPGASSVAALIEGGTVNFERVDVLAGNGADGATGDTPITDIGPSDPNHADIRGNSPGGTKPLICQGSLGSPNPNAAASKVNPKCTSSVGGGSGRGQVDGGQAASDGASGEPAGGSGGETGGGGVVVCDSTGCSCTIGGGGGGGAVGQLGSHGLGAAGIGFLTVDGWEGTTGLSAGRGTHGAGGGGGAGAESGIDAPCGWGGSGGGAGGCGGFGGLGGTSAGGSFAVVVIDGIFSTNAGSLSTGTGGTGGNGGAGQAGAVGGNDGSGGECGGGKGGDGGNGGQGGGGTGGHSIAIAHTPEATVNFGAGTTFTVGAFGPGGTGGNAAGNGASGVAEQVLEIEAK